MINLVLYIFLSPVHSTRAMILVESVMYHTSTDLPCQDLAQTNLGNDVIVVLCVVIRPKATWFRILPVIVLASFVKFILFTYAFHSSYAL